MSKCVEDLWPGMPATGDRPFDRYWRVRATLPRRYLQRCRIVVRGKRNSCMVEFEDGYRTITSRWSVRKLPQVSSLKTQD